jgi:hypothetical protein
MWEGPLRRKMTLMTSPSLITSAVASAVVEDHTNTARIHRARGRSRIRGRRRAASRILVPRGRIPSPSAH